MIATQQQGVNVRPIHYIVIGLGVLIAVSIGAFGLPEKAPQSAADKQSDQRYANAKEFQVEVAKQLREPESVVWEQVATTADGNIVCGVFRSRNGFGGMAREHAVWRADGKLYVGDVWAWGQDCSNAATLVDQTELVAG